MRHVALLALSVLLALLGSCARGDESRLTPGTPTASGTAASETLGDVVTRDPVASRVLRRHGLDFCCGGKKTFAEAAAEKGLDVAALREEIRREVAEADAEDRVRWDERPVVELLDHIVARYHTGLREELPRLLQMSRKVDVAHAHRSERPQGLTRHLEAIAADVTKHLRDEEEVVFPRIRTGSARASDRDVHGLLTDHAALGQALHAMRGMTGDFTPPADACPTWRALYAGLEELEGEIEMHVHLENNVLVPRLPV